MATHDFPATYEDQAWSTDLVAAILALSSQQRTALLAALETP